MREVAEPEGDEPVGLAEPVRQRIVQVAAEVLGRLPVEQVPTSLRAIARFTPAKRQRLGAVAIAAALDVDVPFRQAVADAVAEASASVVAGMREHAELQVTDPLDTAAVAYLARPAGWRQALEEATARWNAENAPREAANSEVARLRAELADVRAQLKSALARTKLAQGALAEQRELAADADDVARLTKQLRSRTGELRTAERERDAAVADLAAARAEAVATAESHADVVRELTARLEESRRGLETGRRAARVERDLDDARLRMLLETLTDAAAGIRRVLALPASAMRPADAVDAGGVGPSTTRGADDAAGLERLLALPQVHLIVDGYNVTKTGYGELPLVDQRSRLLGGVAAWCARSGIEATVAFDGGARPTSAVRTPRGVRVLFSAQDEIADDLIRRLVSAEPEGRPVVVVTSDAAVVTDVRAAGAYTAPSSALLELLR